MDGPNRGEVWLVDLGLAAQDPALPGSKRTGDWAE
jgi:hypothetical protein